MNLTDKGEKKMDSNYYTNNVTDGQPQPPEKKGMSLVLTLGNSILGAYLGATGQLF